MIYYATIDDSGNYTGFYTPTIHGDNIPTPNVELTEQQWNEANTFSKDGKWKWKDGEHTFVLHTQQQLDDWELAGKRKIRNELLILSDWTQIPNNPLSTQKQAEWAEYRQKLRDMFNQKPYVFPTEPNK